MHQWIGSALVQIMACRLLGTNFSEISIKIKTISFMKMHLKISSARQQPFCPWRNELTYWGRVTHIWVSKLPTIGSDNGLSPGRRQTIIWTNAGILLIGPLWTNFSEILIEIPTFSFKKVRLKVSSAKWQPCCFGLNVLMTRRMPSIHAMLEITPRRQIYGIAQT